MESHEIQEPKLVEKNSTFGDRYSHPAYGSIEFSRIQHSHEQHLFGSSVGHYHTIQLTISKADLVKGRTSDHIYEKEEIIRCEMSYSQFAEAITTLNQKPGVPVTLNYIAGEGVLPGCTFENQRTRYVDAFEADMNNNVSTAKSIKYELEELFEKKTLNKSDKQHILSLMDKLIRDTGVNAGYAIKAFNESVDNTLNEAKAEVEAFVQTKMNSIALQAMSENAKISADEGMGFISLGYDEEKKDD